MGSLLAAVLPLLLLLLRTTAASQAAGQQFTPDQCYKQCMSMGKGAAICAQCYGQRGGGAPAPAVEHVVQYVDRPVVKYVDRVQYVDRPVYVDRVVEKEVVRELEKECAQCPAGYIETGDEHTCRCTPKPKVERPQVCVCPDGFRPLDRDPKQGEAVVAGTLTDNPSGAAGDAARAVGLAAAKLGFGRRKALSETAACFCEKAPPPPPPPPEECRCPNGWVPLVDDLKALGDKVPTMNSIRKRIEHSEVGKASQKLVDAGSTVGSAVSGGAKWAKKRLGFGGRRLLECPKCAKKSDVEKMLSGAGKAWSDAGKSGQKFIDDSNKFFKKAGGDISAETKRFRDRVCGKGAFESPSMGGDLEAIVDALQKAMAAIDCVGKFSWQEIYNRAEKCDYGSPPFSNRDGALPPVRGSEFQLDDYIKFGVAVASSVVSGPGGLIAWLQMEAQSQIKALATGTGPVACLITKNMAKLPGQLAQEMLKIMQGKLGEIDVAAMLGLPPGADVVAGVWKVKCNIDVPEISFKTKSLPHFVPYIQIRGLPEKLAADGCDLIPEKCESEDDARRRVTDKYGADSVAWGKEWGRNEIAELVSEAINGKSGKAAEAARKQAEVQYEALVASFEKLGRSEAARALSQARSQAMSALAGALMSALSGGGGSPFEGMSVPEYKLVMDVATIKCKQTMLGPKGIIPFVALVPLKGAAGGKCESTADARKRVTDMYGADNVAWGNDWSIDVVGAASDLMGGDGAKLAGSARSQAEGQVGALVKSLEKLGKAEAARAVSGARDAAVSALASAISGALSGGGGGGRTALAGVAVPGYKLVADAAVAKCEGSRLPRSVTPFIALMR